jgi:hypothetical protein
MILCTFHLPGDSLTLTFNINAATTTSNRFWVIRAIQVTMPTKSLTMIEGFELPVHKWSAHKVRTSIYKYVVPQTVYVPSSELGLSQALSRHASECAPPPEPGEGGGAHSPAG